MKLKRLIIILCFFNPHKAVPQTQKQQAKNSAPTTLRKNFAIDEPTNFTCAELIFYRDKTLAKQFESAYHQYTLGLDAKKDLAEIKNQLLNDKASWYQVISTNTASSDLTLAFAEFANVWKLLCDKYLSLLKIISGNSLQNTGLEYGTKNQEYWYNLLSAGKSLHKAITENADKEAFKMAVSKSNEKGIKKLNDAVQAAIDFSSSLDKFVALEKDHTALKNEVKRLLDMIDIRYREYEDNINASRTTQNSINEVVKAIDKYLSDRNCKTTDAIEEILQTELPKKKLENTVTMQTNKSVAIQNSNAYFIILTTNISLPVQSSSLAGLRTTKHLHIISKPIWYTQNQTDENSIKENFLKEIENQLQNLDKDFHKNFSRNNYELIGFINTNFEASTPLLQQQQCQDAVDNYKKLTLSIDKTAEFLQLK